MRSLVIHLGIDHHAQLSPAEQLGDRGQPGPGAFGCVGIDNDDIPADLSLALSRGPQIQRRPAVRGGVLSNFR